MSARWLLVVLCISAICTAHAVGTSHTSASRQKLLRLQEAAHQTTTQSAESPDAEIKFVKPEDPHVKPLDPMVFTQKPAIIGTQPPAVERIPTPPSAYTHAPRIITAEDLKPDQDLYGDDPAPAAGSSLVATADSQEPAPTDSAAATGVETPATPTESEVENPPPNPADAGIGDMGGDMGAASSTGGVDSTDYPDAGENEQDAKHKFRNALAKDAIPKWFNVLDFVDEENGLEFERARDEATKIVEAELSSFKSEIMATLMEQFGKIIAGQNGGAAAGQDGSDSGDDYDYGEDYGYDYSDEYDYDGGEGEGEGETYHSGYLDGEDDATRSPNGDDEGDSADPAAPSSETPAAPAAPAQTPQDQQVIAALQNEIDSMKNQLLAAQSAAAASAGTSAPATSTPSASTPTETPASTPTETPASTPTETPVSTPTETPASGSEAGAAAAAGGDSQDGSDGEDYGDDYDYDYGDDYDDDYDYDGYGDDYDYDYDAEGGDEWGHDANGRWGRKSGGGGGWASMSAPANPNGGTVRSYGQSGGSGGFTTTVSASTPKTITTVIGTKITPLGNGQTTISQQVERVQVDEYDDGVGSPGWAGNAPSAPVASPGVPEPTPATPTPATPATPTEPAAAATGATEPATTPAAGTVSAEVAAALAKIHEEKDRILQPVHEPTGVDLNNLKALEDSSDLLTRAADEVQRLSTFREKRRLQKLLKR